MYGYELNHPTEYKVVQLALLQPGITCYTAYTVMHLFSY